MCDKTCIVRLKVLYRDVLGGKKKHSWCRKAEMELKNILKIPSQRNFLWNCEENILSLCKNKWHLRYFWDFIMENKSLSIRKPEDRKCFWKSKQTYKNPYTVTRWQTEVKKTPKLTRNGFINWLDVCEWYPISCDEKCGLRFYKALLAKHNLNMNKDLDLDLSVIEMNHWLDGIWLYNC